MLSNHAREQGSTLSFSLYSLIVACLFVFFLAKLATSGMFIDPEMATPTATTSRILPQGVLTLGDGVEPGQRTGEQVFKKTCYQCHAADSTTAKSPKFGVASDWAPRVAQGIDTLMQHATGGFNAMPARGGQPDLTDDEIHRAIVYMANNSGANLAPAPAPDAPEEESAPAEGEGAAAAQDAAPAEGETAADGSASSASAEGSAAPAEGEAPSAEAGADGAASAAEAPAAE